MCRAFLDRRCWKRYRGIYRSSTTAMSLQIQRRLIGHSRRTIRQVRERETLCDTPKKSADRVLKAYYLPPDSVKIPLSKTSKKTGCEWKGTATYYSVQLGGQTIANRIWAYESPTRPFAPIRGYLSFYAGPWDCFVDGEKVEAQPGDFYGGWVTSEVEGIVKGRTGNLDPVV